MKFTARNILTQFPQSGIADNTMSKHFESIKEMHEFYDDDADIQKTIDAFVSILNAKYSAPVKEQEAKSVVKPKSKQPTTKPPKVEQSFSSVEKISPEIGFFKRYISLEGKTARTCHETALRILNSLQKSIAEKVIRKTSPYAEEVMKMQKNLVWIVNNPNNTDELQFTEKFKALAKSQKVAPEIAIIKAFISIQGKPGMKDRAKNLIKRAKKINSNTPEIKTIISHLEAYIGGKVVQIDNQTLKGLYGVAGVECAPKAGDIVSSTDFLGAQFETLKFTGKWRTLIGNPDKNFRVMMFGKPGSGKSTLSLSFAGYLSKNLGLKVLYIAGEEKLGYTLQEKIMRLNIANINLLTTDKVPANLERFDVVFFDSVNTLGLEPEQLRKLPKSIACVYIFQATKDGLFRGSQEFSHDVDTVIKVENMTACTEKNRFGGENTVIQVL